MEAKVPCEGMQKMFDRIARRYDLINTIMTFGLDHAWRRRLARMAQIRPGAFVLDVGAGTGRLSWEAAKRGAKVCALDLSERMLKVGRYFYENESGQGRAGSLYWILGDAMLLPFSDNTFEAVISAYLLRNAPDLVGCLEEQIRVLKPHGLLLAMDTAPPDRGHPLYPILKAYLLKAVPLIGGIFFPNKDPYKYLAGSTMGFKGPVEMERLLKGLGLEGVSHESWAFGLTVIYKAQKPG